MKHAVLIMAHKNKEQLIRLIRSLACPDFDIFVHPDSHWKLSKKDLFDIKTCAVNVTVAKKRIHGELDNWSLVQIALNLIDCAMGTGKNYSYFLLLSGQDYPIKSREYILSFLKEHYPLPMIHCESYDDEYRVRSKFMLVRWMNNTEAVHKKMKPGIMRKLRVLPYVIAEKLENKFYGSPYERLKKYNLELYGGSAWWILPAGVIDYIDKVRKEQPLLIKEYKRTHTPEETFFQTMAMNSPYADRLKNAPDIYDNAERGDMPCMTYANFITPTKPFRGHPHIITTEDFNRIMAKKALFARKFDVNVDETVLDMIDVVIKDNVKKS